MSRFSAFLACVLLLPLPATAAIYRYTDEHGNQVFTNQPPVTAPAQEVELAPPNLIQPPAQPAARPAEDADAEPAAQAFDGYEQLQITGVPAVVRSSSLSVQVLVVPALQSGYRLRLNYDGASQGEPGRSTSFSLSGIERGTHSLQAVIESDEGVVMSSEVVSFTRQQPGLNSPAWGGQKGGGQ